MGYFVQTKDIELHNEFIGKGESIEHLKVWGKDITKDQYEINDGEIKFKNTPYSVTYKACLESGNFFFVPEEAVEVIEDEGPVTILDFTMPDTSNDVIEIEEPKRRGPKKKNI